jgi:hypothetical protein
MASAYILWNIKERRVEGIFNASADATAAARRVSSKSGTRKPENGKAGIVHADLEVLTCTAP